MNATAAVALGALLTLTCSLPGVAHVTAAPAQIAAGTVDEITFRCPNERSASPTVKLVVQLPPDHPLALVKVRPVPGWRVSVTTRRLAQPLRTGHGSVASAADTIAWEGGTIRPGEYQTFSILAGPMPRGVAELTFKAVQTYANGEVVRWIDVRGAGEPVPPHPAPRIRLVQQ